MKQITTKQQETFDKVEAYRAKNPNKSLAAVCTETGTQTKTYQEARARLGLERLIVGGRKSWSRKKKVTTTPSIKQNKSPIMQTLVLPTEQTISRNVIIISAQASDVGVILKQLGV